MLLRSQFTIPSPKFNQSGWDTASVYHDQIQPFGLAFTSCPSTFTFNCAEKHFNSKTGGSRDVLRPVGEVKLAQIFPALFS